MLDAETLKEALKTQLITLWEDTAEGEEGMTLENYADTFAGIIANAVVSHIVSNAVVRIDGLQTITPLPAIPPQYTSVLTAGTIPVTGAITTPTGGAEITGSVA